MTTHRASRATLTFLVVVTACLSAPPGARAQSPAVVTLRLASQTPFTTLKHPTLRVIVDAANASDQTLEDLSVGIQIGEPIRSRTQYHESMTTGPGPSPVFALTFPQTGTLAPGDTHRFTLVLDVTTANLASDDSLVYPAQIDLRTGLVQVATLNTALVHLVREPEEPMRFSWWAEITAPPPLDPSGRLADPAFEASIAPEGSLAGEVDALQQLATDPSRGEPIDVVIEPSVVDALVVMADGYERTDGTAVAAGDKDALGAAAILAALRDIAAAPEVQLSTMPFAGAVLPSLLSSGLTSDLVSQRTLADTVINDALGVRPVLSVARPPQGQLDEASVDALVQGGATTILADADTVARPPVANDYAPLPTASLDTTAGSHADLVLPDPDTEALLQDPELAADPVRTAQLMFGELATIWREAPVPSPPAVRGVALGLPAGLPGAFWSRAIARLADAPFLRPVHAQDFVQEVNPTGPPAVLASPSLATFSRTYVDGIHAERRDIEAFRSMLVEPGPEPDRLERDLLYAEAGTYVGNEQAGRTWIDQVHTTVGDFFSRAQPQESQMFTFTSREGTIPLRMGDPGSTPMKLVVQLQSAWFKFPDGAAQTVTLDRPNQIVSFRVEATAGSQGHPIQMLISAPTGRLLYQQRLVVRTTSVSGIALLITVLAGLGLMVLWTRRIIRRRRSRSTA
jgi:hypothetical protein